MAEDNNRMENAAEDSMKQVQKAGNAATKPIRKVAKKAMKKIGKKVVKAAAKMAAKAVSALVQALISFIAYFWPFILGAIVIVVLAVYIFETEIESKGQNAELQNEVVEEQNDYSDELDENGYPLLEELSDGNKMMRVFYNQFSDKSYYALMNDSDHLYRADSEELKNLGVADKYGREEYFLLSPMMLYTIDHYLNNDELKTPETFIQPVPYKKGDDGKLKLVDITDENKKLTLKSQKYDKETGEKMMKDDKPVTTAGVWDYGFAPVFHYEEYKEEQEYRGRVTQDQKWDKEQQKLVPAGQSELPGGEKKEYIGSKNVWMIDNLVSAAGTIYNEIQHEWEDTGEPWVKTETYEKNVDVAVYGPVHQKNDDGKYLYHRIRYKEIKVPIEDKGIEDTKTDDGSGRGGGGSGNMDAKPKVEYRIERVFDGYYSDLYTTKKNDKPYTETGIVGYEKQKRTFTKVIEGTRFEKIPKYKGEPEPDDASISNEYFLDYFEFYTNYVPEYVMTSINIQERLKTSDKELLKMIADFDDAGGGASSVSVEGLNLGESANAQVWETAVTNIEYFKKYGEMYGVDPYLLVAKAAQEAGGSHYNSDGSVKYKGAGSGAIGIMQIENTGKARTVKAYNQQSGKEDSFTATPEQLKDIDINIKWGAMYFANTIKSANYDFLVALQSYNYGSGFIDYAKKHNNGAWSQEVALAAQKHFANGKARSNPKSPLGPYSHGDAYYIQHVLRYYASPESPTPWVLNENGEKVSMNEDGSVDMGSVGSVNSSLLNDVSSSSTTNGFVKGLQKFIMGITEPLADLLGTDEYDAWNNDDDRRFKFSRSIDDETAMVFLKEIFAFEEMNLLSEYDDMTDDDFKDRFMLMFTNPAGKSIIAKTEKPAINTKDYFPDGFVEPVADAQILKKFGHLNADGDDEYHSGIDIKVGDKDSIKAVAEGTVHNVDKNEIVIKHKNGVMTTYSYVKEVKVKEGDKVKKGQVIAKGSNGKHGKGAFHFSLNKNSLTKDPTWIVKPEQTDVGSIMIDPSAKGHFQVPFPKGEYTVTSEHGYRIHPIKKVHKLHAGIDLVTKKGPGGPIYAIGDGTVLHSKAWATWGNLVVIDHGAPEGFNGNKVFSLYAHMVDGSNTHLKPGDVIKKGEPVGKMGSTGGSTGPHLHLEVTVGPSWSGKPAQTVNPRTIIDF